MCHMEKNLNLFSNHMNDIFSDALSDIDKSQAGPSRDVEGYRKTVFTKETPVVPETIKPQQFQQTPKPPQPSPSLWSQLFEWLFGK